MDRWKRCVAKNYRLALATFLTNFCRTASRQAVSMDRELLQHLSKDEIRQELRGFPSTAVEAVLQLQQKASTARLQNAVLQILAFYLPRGADRGNLSATPLTSRLREDLGVDSLTLSEAAFKMEELFNVRIENAELANIQTVADLTAFAEAKLFRESGKPSPRP